MIQDQFKPLRNLRQQEIQAEFIVVGGGLAGVCAAITAARGGSKVALVQDRPVLGGNSSSEVRLWVLGATSHLGNNNRWSREGGVIDELLLENTYRNPEGNPLIFDAILLDKVVSEPNITLLLNTAVHAITKRNHDTVEAIEAFCSQNSTVYNLQAPLFCDASGDGILGFLSGASFRMGAERAEEFGEKFAPTTEYGELLGHSLYFYSKDTGRPVTYIPPAFALQNIEEIPRFRTFNAKEYGCKLWWVEYGGRLDTVHETETIKWELWKVIYGVWNYIKNSGNFPEAETLTLEWVGMIPGKRESRRFEGDYMLHQQDIVEQRTHADAVAYGGWSIDLHPADGVFSEKPGCNQWHAKGVYQIPYRCLYSKDIVNLFLAGRIISASHVAFGSTRVMATCAHVAQAVGIAANLCLKNQLLPADLKAGNNLEKLQNELLKTGQHIPGLALADAADLAPKAIISASSTLQLQQLHGNGQYHSLEMAIGQLLAVKAGKMPVVSLTFKSPAQTTIKAELRISSRKGSFTPDTTLAMREIVLNAGNQKVVIDFDTTLLNDGYVFVIINQNPDVGVALSEQRVTGLLTVFNGVNKAVSNYGRQEPPENIGVDAFEFWCPQRRPEGKNLAFSLSEAQPVYQLEQLTNGVYRPEYTTNAWVADYSDSRPEITLTWPELVKISQVELFFDADYDHPMETVLMTHPETTMPFCIRNYQLLDERGNIIFTKTGNYQTRNVIKFESPVVGNKLTLRLEQSSKEVPAALFGVRVYS